MKHPKVINFSQLPAKLPVTSSIAWYLLLDKINAPGWLWGMMGTVFVVLWIGVIVAICVQEPIELTELKGE